MTDYLIRLPWPAPALWQNRRVHWRVQSRATKAARTTAWALAKEQGVQRIPDATLVFTFHPPSKHKRDIQNMPATQKAAIDGIADAMGCDDGKFRVRWPEQFDKVTPSGCVLVHIIPPLVNIELRGSVD